MLAAAKSSGRNPYPHKFQITTYLPEYVAKYKDLEPGTKLTEERVSVAGKHHFLPVLGVQSFTVCSCLHVYM
jgi:lysyl-tRNA synthetase class 2